MKHSFTFILLFALSLPICLYAQSPRLYGTAQGLIDTRIDRICFDRDNFMWISTESGLVRFDGQTFTTYTSEKEGPDMLGDSRVSEMYETANGRHYIGTGNGLYYLCRTENRFTHHVIDSMRPNISVSGIEQHPLKENTLIVATSGFGLFLFDTKTESFNQEHSAYLSFCLKRWNCRNILVDSHRNLWATHPQGIRCIDLENTRPLQINADSAFIEQLSVQAMVEDDRNDIIYMATQSHGLVRCNTRTRAIERIDLPLINSLNLTALCFSPKGDLIIGTENQGLYRMHMGKVSAIEYEDCPVDLQHVKIHSLAYDDQDNLWLGLYQKGILVLPSQETLFSKRAIKPEGGIHNLANVSSFASMSDGSRLYGLDGAGLIHRKADGSISHLDTRNSVLGSDAVLSLAAIGQGKAYVGTYNTGVYLYDGHRLVRDPHLAMLDQQSIMTMSYDSLMQTIYMGTNGDGIYIYNTDTQQLSRLSGEMGMLWISSVSTDRRHRLWGCTSGTVFCYDPEAKMRSELPYNKPVRAYSYAEDNTGTIWLASDKGILYYGAGSDSLRIAYDSNGRPLSGKYSAILRSQDGKLWLSSGNGISSFDPRTHNVINYADPNIADVGSYSVRAAIQWPDCTMSFGGDNGELTFSPEKVDAYHRYIRPVHFTRLWVNNTPTDYDPTLSREENVLDESLWKATLLHLPYPTNSFSISFAVQEYCNPVGISYKYKLDGYDNDWHESHGSNPTASYASLRWGRYRFRVQAIQLEGNGKAQVIENSMLIRIDAPWWATWWAMLIYSLVLIATIAHFVWYVRHRTHQKRVLERTQHNRQIKEAKLRMFASVSHEIKTPLTLIISPLRKLMERNNDNATQSVYEMMYRNALRILMLVNQQMDIRKLDSGELRLHVRELSLRPFVDDLMQYFSNAAINRQIDFRLNIPEGQEDISIWADPQQIDKVFFNLLSNAFKYVNDKGQVLINASTNGGNCVIEVFNSGSRLENIDPKHLFEHMAEESGSTGIGLSLAHELTAMHHGELSARNDETGVTFCLSLPLGNRHFTALELRSVAPEATDPIEKAIDVVAQAQPDETITAKPADKDRKESDDKELIDLLNDELREKKRLRERRSNLGFDYSQRQMSSADEKLLNRVVDCIHKNLGDSDFSVDLMAQQVGLSRVHLNRKLKELLDTSPSTLIKTTRLKQAAFLLVQSNVTVAEVAYSVGFSSPAYFTSNFSSYFGMTPKEFINTYTENPDSESLKKLLE
ncbi:MAG: helix-turn-helix domain-containing protein [Bacteroidales bacterium]|nr:helix-turn-helix domain-containing protein [Candidatus Liminaster caballi]